MDDKWRDTYDQWKLASPYDDYEDPPEDPYDDEDDLDIDVCQHCGGYFAWGESHAETAEKNGFPPGTQRCERCMRDECWIEREQF